MSGLFQKALTLRDTSTSAPLGGNASSRNVSPEERREILIQIDELVEKNRVKFRPESFVVYPQRRGSVMPLLINAAAVLVVVLGGLLFLWLSDRQQEAIVVDPQQFQTAEGKLIAAIRSESEEQMATKDRQILDAQQRLEEVRAERDRVQNESNDRLRTQEERLRNEFQTELDAERARLIGLGVSGDDLAQRMRAYEEQRRSEYDTRLAALRAEVDRELQEKEAAIAGLILNYESTLNSVQQERERLKSELATREAELQAGLQQREQELQTDRERITAELGQLAAQRDREQLTLDQILSFYDAVNLDLQAGRNAEALAGLATLREFLDQPQVAALPAIERRRPVETFIVASLRELIEERSTPAQDTSNLVASAEILARVGQTIDQGNRAFREGRIPEARELYEQGLREIPEIRNGYERLAQIDTLAEQAEAERLADLIETGDRRYVAREYQASIDRYSDAIRTLGEGRPEVERMVARILDAGFQIYEAERPPQLSDPATLVQLREAQARLETAEAELDAQRRDYLAAVAERDALSVDLARARELYENASGEGSTDQEQLNRLLAEVERLEEAYRESEAERARITRDTEEAATLLELQQQRYDELSDELVTVEAGRRTVAADLRSAEASRRETLVQLERLREDSREHATVLAAERDEAVAQAERFRTAAGQTSEERTRLTERIAALKSDLIGTSGAEEPSDEEIRRLLGAKILVKQIIDTEAVRAEYPDLSRDLDQYFDQRAQLGREQALADVLGILEYVEGTLAEPRLTTNSTEKDLLLRILGVMETLIP